jgi:hypothetical protein
MRSNLSSEMQRYFKWRCIFLCLPSNVSDCVCNAIKKPHPSGWGFLYGCEASFNRPPGYEADERSSLGKRGERCLRQMKRPERSAAVGKIEEKRKPEDFFGHRKPGCRND